MAENKKSFILYVDILSTFEELKDSEAGRLIKHLLRYVNDLNPDPPDRLTKIAFEPIKHQLKRDLKEWEETKQERSESGRLGNLKRWNPDLFKKVANSEISLEHAENIAKNRIATKRVAKIAVNVNDNVTVNVNDNVINNNTWDSIKKFFLEDGPWQLKILTEKKISLAALEQKQKEFLSDIELKEDFKELRDLKNHFINWFNKQKNSNGSSSKQQSQRSAVETAIRIGQDEFAALRKKHTGG